MAFWEDESHFGVGHDLFAFRRVHTRLWIVLLTWHDRGVGSIAATSREPADQPLTQGDADSGVGRLRPGRNRRLTAAPESALRSGWSALDDYQLTRLLSEAAKANRQDDRPDSDQTDPNDTAAGERE